MSINTTITITQQPEPGMEALPWGEAHPAEWRGGGPILTTAFLLPPSSARKTSLQVHPGVSGMSCPLRSEGPTQGRGVPSHDPGKGL